MRSGKESAMFRVELLLPALLVLFLGGVISDLGSIMDPDGRSEASTGDSGSGMDPNG
jgi:hypothetical protein